MLRASTDEEKRLSTTIYYHQLNFADNLKRLKNIICETSCRQLNAKIASCQQVSSFPFERGNCLVVDNLQFLHLVVNNSSHRQCVLVVDKTWLLTTNFLVCGGP